LAPTSRDVVESKTLPDGSVLVQNTRGSARLTRLGPGALFWVCTGFLSHAFYEPMVRVAQREMDGAGKLVIFVDGWNLHSVDTAFRESWTAWFKVNKQRFEMQLLVRTKLMEMAASIANLFTGLAVVKTHSSIGSWERACSLSFSGFRRNHQATG
jgi:hypothetical protein